MRLVSQDGMIDVPYEEVSLEINDKEIYCGYSSTITRHCTGRRMAEYSTHEKALKVMEMLRKAYVGLPILFQNVNMDESVVDKLKEWKRDGIVLLHDNAETKIEQVNNAIFVFPKDEEVE